MRIEHLYYLVHIANTKSITLSAEHLFITQQGLSQSIHRLEMDLDVSLFRRCSQGVSLTDAGNMAVEKAKEIILKYEELLQSMEPYSNANSSTSPEKISLGVAPFISNNVLPEILDLFRKKHPAVNIQIEELKPVDIVQQLNAGCVDIGLVILPDYYCFDQIHMGNVIFEKVYDNKLLACVAKSSPLAQKSMLSIAEIKKHPIVVYNLEPYLEILAHMFGDLSKLNIIVKTNSREIYMKAIIHSKAVGITPLSDFKLLNEKSIVSIPITDSIRLDLGWLVSTRYPLSSAADEFLAIFKSYLKSKIPLKVSE